MTRLTLVAHGMTEGARRGIFGDTTEPLHDGPLTLNRPHHTDVLLAGPEPACRVDSADIVGDLRGPDAGEWSGLSLEDVMGSSPELLRAWIGDPTVAPPGGESLVDHLRRVGDFLDWRDWPDSGAVIVATPATVRAACLHVLGAGPGSLRHLDVAPGAQVTVTRNRGIWRMSLSLPHVRS